MASLGQEVETREFVLLFADHCFPLPVVEKLRRMGHDVSTAQEAGQATASDEDLLAYASRDGRAVLTINRVHFRNLHNASANHGGIIICTEDPDRLALAARIDAAINASGPLAGQLIRIVRPPR